MNETLSLTPAWFGLLSLILNLLLGSGLIITFFTLKSVKKKANAEAKGADASAESTELDNVSKAILIWQNSAEMSERRAQAAEQRAAAAEQRSQATAHKYTQLAEEVSNLRTEVKKVTCTNQRIIKLLDSINHDNLDQKKLEAKELTNEKE